MGIKLSPAQFIHRAQLQHKNKYDYSVSDYQNSSTYINIICPIHGIFTQCAKSHLNGSGCQKCANIKRGDGRAFVWNEDKI